MIGHPPVFRLKGKQAGKTLFITGGMDGDEYAGMAAAYKLIEEFSYASFGGNLIIVPIVNIPGFRTQTSENPIDGMFPKYIFPGKKNGTPTERLCWWVRELAGTSDFWLDMHGGAQTEILEPFVGSWASGNIKIDKLVSEVISSISCNYASFEHAPFVSKTKLLARMGCGYLLTESGELGKINNKDVERHSKWVRQVMSVLGMLDQKKGVHHKTLFHHIHEYAVQNNGLWRPQYSVCRQVKKGEILGDVRSLMGKSLEKVIAKENGMLLWGKVDSSARRADVVAGIGSVCYDRNV